jgi:cysteine-rich repeat protein
MQPGEECDDGNSETGDGCSSDCLLETITTNCQTGQARTELFLEADDYSYSENELYFFESTGDATQDLEFIWIGTERGIENNKYYELSECVDSMKCYKFYFFDTFGDGLSGQTGLRLLWDGVEELVIQPNEVGELWEGGPTVYWSRDLGNC